MKTSTKRIHATRYLCEACGELRDVAKVNKKKPVSNWVLLTCGHVRTSKLLKGRAGAESIESLTEETHQVSERARAVRERTRSQHPPPTKLTLTLPSTPSQTSSDKEEAA